MNLVGFCWNVDLKHKERRKQLQLEQYSTSNNSFQIWNLFFQLINQALYFWRFIVMIMYSPDPVILLVIPCLFKQFNKISLVWGSHHMRASFKPVNCYQYIWSLLKTSPCSPHCSPTVDPPYQGNTTMDVSPCHQINHLYGLNTFPYLLYWVYIEGMSSFWWARHPHTDSGIDDSKVKLEPSEEEQIIFNHAM